MRMLGGDLITKANGHRPLTFGHLEGLLKSGDHGRQAGLFKR